MADVKSGNVPYDSLLWQKTVDLAETVYRQTGRFPQRERLGLAAELRRTALALPALAAEYFPKPVPRFLHGLKRVRRLLWRLETQVRIADHLHYWPATAPTGITRRIADIHRLLQAFFITLRPCRTFGRPVVKTIRDREPTDP